METPPSITQLEKALGVPLYPAPAHGHDPVRNVLACRRDPHDKDRWQPRYALHPDGAVAGLNLAGRNLTDPQWQQIAALLPLDRLEALNLRQNRLTALPGLDQMPSLRYLDLCDNQLTEFALPPNGPAELKHLWLYGNAFRDQVLLARAQQGRHALLEHLFDLAKGAMEEIYEARMLIIGEPRAGKTSLRKKLQDVKNALPQVSTKGIEVDDGDLERESNSFPYKTPSGKDVTFHYQVWDFGGQRQYHPTHQLFFAKSTLYVLVTNTDYDHKNEGDVEFWLETVSKLGEGSPVLRFQNAQSDRPDSTDWKDINRRFGGIIKGVFTLNLSRVNPGEPARYRDKDAKEFALLKEAIVSQMKALEHVGSKVTPTWHRIREAIAQRAREVPYISLEDYQRLCTDCGYPDPERQLDLSKTFHTLGIFLHYQHNALLRNTIVLQSKWAIDAVFAILDSPILLEKQGRFDQRDLPSIWESKEYEGKRDDLLQLLQEFELCYPLNVKGRYVAPQCLPKSSPPQYEWNESDNVQVDVTYDFLPRAVITRLLVKMHEFIAHEKQWAWQHGAVLAGDALRCKGTEAYIQEVYKERKITIRLRGEYSEDLFREIQVKLRDIHADFPQLEVDYVIYCNCEACKQSGAPTPFSYFNDLLRYRRELKLEEIECRSKGKKVKISDILSGIISPAQAREDQHSSIHLTGSIKELGEIMAKSSQNSTPEKSSNGIYGALIAFVIVLPTIALCVNLMNSMLAAVLVIVATILVLMLVLVYAGTQSKTLSEDAFVKISERILSKIPGLGSLVTLIKGQ